MTAYQRHLNLFKKSVADDFCGPDANALDDLAMYAKGEISREQFEADMQALGCDLAAIAEAANYRWS